MGISYNLSDHSSDSYTKTKQKTNDMKLVQFLLPLLLVASVSSFSIKSLFSHEEKAEEAPVEEPAVENVDEEASEEDETEEEDELEDEDLDAEALEEEEEEDEDE